MSTLFFLSCGKNKDDSNKSRILKYEVRGNFGGSLIASYTTATGGTAHETITSLSWSKEITYASNVSAAIIAITGNGGATGQQILVVNKKSNIQISSTPIVTGNSGSFSKAVPVVTF